MPEPLLLVLGLLVAAAIVLAPLRWPAPAGPADDERDAALVRHRVALEALRDVEADRRAGSLDERAYAEQLAEAEARAAATRAALERRTVGRIVSPSRAARPALGVAAVIGTALVVGSLVPASGVANATIVNEQLAAARAAEDARQARIGELLDDLAATPDDTEVLSDLADAYLAGSSGDDLARAAAALQLLIGLEPDRADAYERILGAYLRAGDFVNARSAHDTYASIATADPVEVAFYDGLIALRGEDDPEAAVAAFDRFLELAPDDPRAEMIRGLREEAAAG